MLSDLQVILTNLSGYSVPDFFVPVTDPAPEQPESLQQKFGTYAENPDYASAFNNYYNIDTNTWATDDRSIAPDDLRNAVADQLALILSYDGNLLTWNINYAFEKDFQWRRKLADKILATDG